MAQFKLIPIDGLMAPVEFAAVSAASVLDIAMRSMLGESDVYCDGSYQCTVRHGSSGLWIITQREIARSLGGSPGNQADETFRVDPNTQVSCQPEMA